MKRARPHRANRIKNRTVHNWGKGCLSDESHFEILGENAYHSFACIGKHPLKVAALSITSGKGTGMIHHS